MAERLQRSLIRLDAIHDKLLSLVAVVDDAPFRLRPAANEWSVAEVIQHLSLVERHVINALERSLVLPQQDLPIFRRLVPTRLVQLRLFRVQAPRAVQPLDPPPREELIATFNATRESLKALCIREGNARLRHTIFKHPFFGPIDGTAAISFLGHHEVRHYKQIRAVLKKLDIQER